MVGKVRARKWFRVPQRDGEVHENLMYIDPPLTRFQRYSTNRPGDVLEKVSGVGLDRSEQVVPQAFDDGAVLGREVQMLAVRPEHIEIVSVETERESSAPSTR
jgi:hypothetical protein